MQITRAKQADQNHNRINRTQRILIWLAAAVTITLLSRSSFLYPINDWVDANCFFTVGKSMLSGKLPYRDLYEQKGPLIYFLHAFAAMISYRSFFGVYLFEIAACASFLIFSVKTSLYLTRSKLVPLIIPFICAVTYSSTSFRRGDSVEEFFLPLLAYSLYVGIVICTEEAADLRRVYVTGICTGLILWTKYTCLGFYIGWILALSVLFLSQKRVEEFLRSALCYFGGVVTVSVPVLVYFGLNGALYDLFRVYFYNNTVIYRSRAPKGAGGSGILTNIYGGICEAFRNNTALALLIVICIFMLNRHRKKTVNRFLITTLLVSCVFVYCGAKTYPYYSLIYYAYLGAALDLPVILAGNVSGLKRKWERIPAGVMALVSAACLIYAVKSSINSCMLLRPKSEMPQFQFAEIINQEPDAVLLNYGFLDGGFYTAAGLVPAHKYYCKMNIPLEDMQKAQKRYIWEASADFVVTRNREIKNEQYTLAAETVFADSEYSFVFRLYRLKDSAKQKKSAPSKPR